LKISNVAAQAITLQEKLTALFLKFCKTYHQAPAWCEKIKKFSMPSWNLVLLKKTTMKLYKCLIINVLLFLNIPATAQKIAIANTKMNTVYIGLDNPITVAVANHSPETIQVKVSQGTIRGEKGRYNWTVTKPGIATLTVFAEDKKIATFEYRVKPLPNPVARLGHENSGTLSTGVLKAQIGIGAWLENMDINATCRMISYKVTLVRQGQDPIQVENLGARFTKETQALIDSVQSGDVFFFEEVKCRCPGDENSRKINSLVFRIE
jgi:hypothetical protein